MFKRARKIEKGDTVRLKESRHVKAHYLASDHKSGKTLIIHVTQCEPLTVLEARKVGSDTILLLTYRDMQGVFTFGEIYASMVKR